MIARTCLFVYVLGLRRDVTQARDTTGSHQNKAFFRCEPELGTFDDFHSLITKWQPFRYHERKPEFVAQQVDYQHRSHAGIWEFPFLLDVRTVNSEAYEETEEWFNANLVTSKFALTTCDAVATFVLADEPRQHVDGNGRVRYVYSWKDKDKLLKNNVLQKKDPKKYKILYASAFNYKVTLGWEYEVGTREIESFFPHPSCTYFHVDFSYGIIKIQDPIYPFPPYTSFMHVDFNCTSFQELKVKYNMAKGESEHKGRLDDYHFDDAACTIGLWGRYIPADGPLNLTTAVVNYKLRYRVRFVDPQECKNAIYMFPQRFQGQPVQYIECMGLVQNETIGAICDHDKGAPVVCGEGEDEAVRAFLIAGVLKSYCNNTKPQLFMVADARMIFPLFAHINVLALNNITRGRIVRYSGNGVSSLYSAHECLYSLKVYFMAVLAVYYMFG